MNRRGVEGAPAAVLFVASLAAAVLVAYAIYNTTLLFSKRPLVTVLPTPYCQGGTLYMMLENDGSEPLDVSSIRIVARGQELSLTCSVDTIAPGQTAVCTTTCPEGYRAVLEYPGGSIVFTFTRV